MGQREREGKNKRSRQNENDRVTDREELKRENGVERERKKWRGRE